MILLADRPGEREQAVRQLIRIGFDDLHGYLEGGMPAWKAQGLPVGKVPILPADELERQLNNRKAPPIIDVSSEAEWRAGHLPHAIHVEAGRLPAEDLSLPQDELKIVHCGHSGRSTVGISVLERRGVRNLALLDGGYSGWHKAGNPEVRENE